MQLGQRSSTPRERVGRHVEHEPGKCHKPTPPLGGKLACVVADNMQKLPHDGIMPGMMMIIIMMMIMPSCIQMRASERGITPEALIARSGKFQRLELATKPWFSLHTDVAKQERARRVASGLTHAVASAAADQRRMVKQMWRPTHNSESDGEYTNGTRALDVLRTGHTVNNRPNHSQVTQSAD